MKISRQAYYKRQDTSEERKKTDAIIVDAVKGERVFQPRLGGRKLHFILKQKQFKTIIFRQNFIFKTKTI